MRFMSQRWRTGRTRTPRCSGNNFPALEVHFTNMCVSATAGLRGARKGPMRARPAARQAKPDTTKKTYRLGSILKLRDYRDNQWVSAGRTVPAQCAYEPLASVFDLLLVRVSLLAPGVAARVRRVHFHRCMIQRTRATHVDGCSPEGDALNRYLD